MNKQFFDHITRPTLILNELRARENIRGMAFKARRSGVNFRPHFKTHQSIEIGNWFRDEGVQQITVSSVEMAEYFSADGWSDITIAFPINIRQLDQIQVLAGRINLGIVVESLETLIFLGKSIQSKINIWLKIDSGSHRTGIPSENTEELLSILSEIKLFPKLVLQGILTHAGSTYSAHSSEEAVRLHSEATRRMIDLQQKIINAGYPKVKISIGDTPGCCRLDTFVGVDEIRPGNFVFFDAEQLEIGSCRADQISVALACPIVARHPERNEVVLYGGAIHLSKESYLHAGKPSYGLVAFTDNNGWGEILPDCSVLRVSQEHGILSVPQAMMPRFIIGGLVMVIPVHSCLTAHLMRRYFTLDGKTIDMMPV
jgi:D-serine deaminase-like pyridoxal phosphate-dependent protein